MKKYEKPEVETIEFATECVMDNTPGMGGDTVYGEAVTPLPG